MDVRFVFDEIDLIQNYIWFLCRLPRIIVQTWKVSGPCWFMSPAIKKTIYLPHIYRLHCVVVYVCNQHSNAEVMKLAMLWVLGTYSCPSPIWIFFWKFSNWGGWGGGFSIPKKYISGGSIHINSLFIFFFWLKCCLITFANFTIFTKGWTACSVPVPRHHWVEAKAGAGSLHQNFLPTPQLGRSSSPIIVILDND